MQYRKATLLSEHVQIVHSKVSSRHKRSDINRLNPYAFVLCCRVPSPSRSLSGEFSRRTSCFLSTRHLNFPFLPPACFLRVPHVLCPAAALDCMVCVQPSRTVKYPSLKWTVLCYPRVRRSSDTSASSQARTHAKGYRLVYFCSDSSELRITDSSNSVFFRKHAHARCSVIRSC